MRLPQSTTERTHMKSSKPARPIASPPFAGLFQAQAFADGFIDDKGFFTAPDGHDPRQALDPVNACLGRGIHFSQAKGPWMNSRRMGQLETR